MELVSRMMDGSVSYDPKDRLGPALSGSGDEQKGKIDLEEVPFRNGCSQRQLRSVAKIARVLDAAAGTVLTHRGESGDEFFLILDGTANVHLSDEKSVSLGPGAFFGEMSLLDWGHARPRSLRRHRSALLWSTARTSGSSAGRYPTSPKFCRSPLATCAASRTVKVRRFTVLECLVDY